MAKKLKIIIQFYYWILNLLQVLNCISSDNLLSMKGESKKRTKILQLIQRSPYQVFRKYILFFWFPSYKKKKWLNWTKKLFLKRKKKKRIGVKGIKILINALIQIKNFFILVDDSAQHMYFSCLNFLLPTPPSS